MPDPADPRGTLPFVPFDFAAYGRSRDLTEKDLEGFDTDPRAVADDPSGIVQQMPEVGDGALAPCPFCGGAARVYGPVGWHRQYGISHSCSVFYGGSGDFTAGARTKEQAIATWNRRATEADLRAEVESLTKRVAEWRSEYHAAQKGLDLYRRKNMELVAEVKRLRSCLNDTHIFCCGSSAYEATLLADRNRAALSPETDGGQDAPADS